MLARERRCRRARRGFLLWAPALLVCFCACIRTQAEGRGKLSEMVIVSGKDVIPAERTAAGELAHYLGEVTGAALAQVTETDVPEGRDAIYVGRTGFAARQGIDFSKLGNEEWVIRTFGRDLILAGGRPRGALYAACEFLEKYVGCHWLAEDTEVIPRAPDLVLPEINVTGRPAFEERGVYDYFASLNNTPEFWARWRRNNAQNKHNTGSTHLGAEYGFMNWPGTPARPHSFYLYLDPREHFAEHPEYFSVGKNGKRESSGGQLCLTNPEVRRLVLEKLRGFIAGDRKRFADDEEGGRAGARPYRVYPCSTEDFHHLCRCETCQTITRREGSESGPLIEFINVLADGIKDEYPDVVISTLAYIPTQKPPRTLRPRPNVLIFLADWGVDSRTGSLDKQGECFRPLSHPYNAQFVQYLQKWLQIANHVWVWDYWRVFGGEFVTPYSNVRFIQADLQLLKDAGVKGIFAQSSNPVRPSFAKLQRWLALKLLQDPYQPAEPLIEVFMNGYYGSAAPKMQEYLNYLDQRIREDPDKLIELSPLLRKYLDWDFFTTATRLLDEAETACRDDAKALLHVRRERIPVEGALLNLWGKLRGTLPAGAEFPFDRQTVLDRYERNRYAQLEAACSPGLAGTYKAEAAAELERLRAGDIPLPERFRGLPRERVIDFAWPLLSGSGAARLVDDPDAAGGKAWRLGKGPDFQHSAPLHFGVHDQARKVEGPRVLLPFDEMPQDGKYHWYKIGRFPVTNQVMVWLPAAWYLSADLTRAYDPAASDHTCDIWISLKVNGPAYVKGSQETSSVSFDRVTVVR